MTVTETKDIEVKVTAIIPEYQQARVETTDGTHYALTRTTEGVNYADLIVGQKLDCTVTTIQPRVVRASLKTPSA